MRKGAQGIRHVFYRMGVFFLMAVIITASSGCSVDSEMVQQAKEQLKERYQEEFQVGEFKRESGYFPGDGTEAYEAVAFPKENPDLKFPVRMYVGGELSADGYIARLVGKQLAQRVQEGLLPLVQQANVFVYPLNHYAGGWNDDHKEKEYSPEAFFQDKLGAVSIFILLQGDPENGQQVYNSLNTVFSAIPECKISFNCCYVKPEDFSNAEKWVNQQAGTPKSVDLNETIPLEKEMGGGFEKGAMTVTLEQFLTIKDWRE